MTTFVLKTNEFVVKGKCFRLRMCCCRGAHLQKSPTAINNCRIRRHNYRRLMSHFDNDEGSAAYSGFLRNYSMTTDEGRPINKVL
jgi:hypothetical protein